MAGDGQDDTGWTLYVKGVKRAKPVKKRVASAATPARTRPAPQQRDAAATLAAQGRKIAAHDPTVLALDKRVERAMRQGSFAVEGKLDLHGLRLDEARQALLRFVAARAEAGQRRLLVITGKGKAGESVLRAALPSWCAEAPLAGIVLALRPAAPAHGGDGAWYMLLRRAGV